MAFWVHLGLRNVGKITSLVYWYMSDANYQRMFWKLLNAVVSIHAKADLEDIQVWYIVWKFKVYICFGFPVCLCCFAGHGSHLEEGNVRGRFGLEGEQRVPMVQRRKATSKPARCSASCGPGLGSNPRLKRGNRPANRGIHPAEKVLFITGSFFALFPAT